MMIIITIIIIIIIIWWDSYKAHIPFYKMLVALL